MKFSSVSINVADVLRRNWKHVLVEGDSKLVLDAICGACDVPWNLKPIIEDIKEANFVADALASIGLNSSNLCIWDVCLPMDAHLPFQFDCISTGCVRGFSL
ncbi:hypothetical protein D8674_008593 [Pyrus ussuriensis x Pyrus communis]|uniref:RNase H type-1 domain-containing protein n=1 Tax=Pyrus ussuriensis x Pyrus communis TaxID=2448454 RepID=A0A5N5I645_9ROSA|nr:hypothetical protein D8674_008593 [Pyrus ussuriensis x Pyrus communis]